MTDAQSPVRRYPTAVDWWLGLLIIAVPVIVIGSAILLTATAEAVDAAVGWLTVVGVIALYVGLVWPIAYELHPEALVIRFGLVRSRIRYDRIRGVRPTRSFLASPAMSVHRLAIDLGGSVPPSISPADRDGFLADLAARAPHLRREGESLVSRAP